MAIDVTVAGESEFAARLDPARLLEVLDRRLTGWNTEFAGYIAASKLSGRPALNRVTGNLSLSVSSRTPNVTQSGGRFRCVAGADESAFYGKIHETGGVFARKVGGRKQGTVALSDKAKAERSEAPGGYGTVTFPARPWLEPSVMEKRDTFPEAVQEGIREALHS